VTQMASNGWRGLLWRRHVHWPSVAGYVAGGLVAASLWSLTRYVPSKPVALLFLGVPPLLYRLLPERRTARAARLPGGLLCGAASMSLLLLTGVAGPLLDAYFLGSSLDRRGIVATKAMCQIFGHGVKLVYFGNIIDQAASLDPGLAMLAVLASMIGTSLARRFVEAMTDRQFRSWAGRLVTAVSGYYTIQGGYLLVMAGL